jgi:hypothetical protein
VATLAVCLKDWQDLFVVRDRRVWRRRLCLAIGRNGRGKWNDGGEYCREWRNSTDKHGKLPMAKASSVRTSSAGHVAAAEFAEIQSMVAKCELMQVQLPRSQTLAEYQAIVDLDQRIEDRQCDQSYACRAELASASTIDNGIWRIGVCDFPARMPA